MSAWDTTASDDNHGRAGSSRIEFKRDAVDLLLTTGRPIAEVAAELGLYDATLGNWVRKRQDQQAAGENLSADERARLKEPEAENAKLRISRSARFDQLLAPHPSVAMMASTDTA